MPGFTKAVDVNKRTGGVLEGKPHHVVISRATMISSLMMRAVKEIDTIFKNSVSKRTRDIIMMAAPMHQTE
jgi:hypothetical protein